MGPFVLAIDQGTTSTRVIIFDPVGQPVVTVQRELPQIYPADGWVEHDPRIIWQDTKHLCGQAIQQAGIAANQLVAFGITNQRETTIVWDRRTGEPIYNAIVWQDRRTTALCGQLAQDGAASLVSERTGLVLDSYFSASKIAWILDHVPGARAAAERGELAFGTVDSWLLWNLTGGSSHATDATNAARTLLYDIRKHGWDEDLLRLFNVPRSVLPDVKDNAALFGTVASELPGAGLPVAGMAGDQQAASIGQACLTPGLAKCTYGTGCFALLNTGAKMQTSRHQLLNTLAWRIAGDASYAMEGSIFSAGAGVQWLRDGLGIIEHAAATEAMARAVGDSAGVYVVPAFTGLGAPYWDSTARGAILGLTRDSTAAHVVRATLESVAYQTRELMDAMAADTGQPVSTLRVDGGMVQNDWLCQFLADILEIAVERPQVTETTALGAARLAGLHVGIHASIEGMGRAWQLDRRFEPQMPNARVGRLLIGWKEAVARVLSREG